MQHFQFISKTVNYLDLQHAVRRGFVHSVCLGQHFASTWRHDSGFILLGRADGIYWRCLVYYGVYRRLEFKHTKARSDLFNERQELEGLIHRRYPFSSRYIEVIHINQSVLRSSCAQVSLM